jgi:ribosome-binding ATPase YchF (GTP1/OBG family)
MSYRIGLVGKPSVGKSTFFNAATMNDVPEGAYPFTTIDPSVGEAYVRVECAAPEFDRSCTPETGLCRDETRFVPTKLVDVAGLIPGAHEGHGLGNQFLTDLNETDVLIHVVDFSGTTDAEGEPTEGHDPREDIEFLETELDMWYLEILEKGIEKFANRYAGEESDIEVELAEQMSAFRITKDEIKRLILRLDIGFDPVEWDKSQRAALAREIRMETKPLVIAANKMDTPEAQANYEAITADPAYEHLRIVPASAHAEKALKRADEQDVIEYRAGDSEFELRENLSGEQEAGLARIAEFTERFDGTGVQHALETALFSELDAIAVFPGSANGDPEDGKFMRDCFVLPEGSTTEDFAYFLHSDIGDGLLHGIDCRNGRQVGANHELTHRDVIEIISTN